MLPQEKRLKQAVEKLRLKGLTFEQIGREYALSRGEVFNITTGIFPKAPEKRKRLGLPKLTKVYVTDDRLGTCAQCGSHFARWPNQRFCDSVCKRKAAKANGMEKKKQLI